MKIDENLSNADWIKAKKPPDTIAEIQKRANQEHQDQIQNMVDKHAAKVKETTKPE